MNFGTFLKLQPQIWADLAQSALEQALTTWEWLLNLFFVGTWNVFFMLFISFFICQLGYCNLQYFLPFVRYLEVHNENAAERLPTDTKYKVVLAPLCWLHYTIQFKVLLFIFNAFKSLTPPLTLWATVLLFCL